MVIKSLAQEGESSGAKKQSMQAFARAESVHTMRGSWPGRNGRSG